MRAIEALGIIAGGVLLYTWSQSRAAGNLTFFPGNIQGMSFEGSNPVANIDLLVQNTSGAEIQLNSIAANVFTNGSLVGNVSNFTPAIIAPNNASHLPLTIRFQLLGVINDVISAFQTGSTIQNVEVKGSANANGIQIPLDITYKFGA